MTRLAKIGICCSSTYLYVLSSLSGSFLPKISGSASLLPTLPFTFLKSSVTHRGMVRGCRQRDRSYCRLDASHQIPPSWIASELCGAVLCCATCKVHCSVHSSESSRSDTLPIVVATEEKNTHLHARLRRWQIV